MVSPVRDNYIHMLELASRGVKAIIHITTSLRLLLSEITSTSGNTVKIAG